MGFIAFAVLGGLALGYARGGRLRHLATRTFRHSWLLPGGAVLQLAPELAAVPAPAWWIAASYVAMAAFALLNLHVVGMGVALVGLAMNVAVIFANGAMPVRADAVVAAGVAAPGDVHELDLGAKRRLERPGDHLTALGDIVPIPALGEVLSFGDLVLAAGVGNVVARLLEPRRRDAGALRLRRRPTRPPTAPDGRPARRQGPARVPAGATTPGPALDLGAPVARAEEPAGEERAPEPVPAGSAPGVVPVATAP